MYDKHALYPHSEKKGFTALLVNRFCEESIFTLQVENLQIHPFSVGNNFIIVQDFNY